MNFVSQSDVQNAQQGLNDSILELITVFKTIDFVHVEFYVSCQGSFPLFAADCSNVRIELRAPASLICPGPTGQTWEFEQWRISGTTMPKSGFINQAKKHSEHPPGKPAEGSPRGWFMGVCG